MRAGLPRHFGTVSMIVVVLPDLKTVPGHDVAVSEATCTQM